MTDPNENKSATGCDCNATLAFLLLRGWLAVRAILTGIEKFGAYKIVQQPVIDQSTGQPDASGVLQNVSIKYYSLANYSGIPGSFKDKFAHEPLLPKFALTAFDHLLGPLFIATGVMLLVGLCSRCALLVQGLIYIALTVGLILIHQDDGISWLGIHIALVAFALTLLRHNKFTLFKKC